MKNENQNTAAQASNTGSVALLALFRLALLIGPETAVVKVLSHSPVVCVLAAVAVLAIWLSVDVWPFRAAVLAPAEAPIARPTPVIQARTLSKAQLLSCLTCQALLFVAFMHSKLTV